MAVAALRWFKAALALQVLLVGYWLAVSTVELAPWNDLAGQAAGQDLALSVALNALPLLAFTLLFASGTTFLATLSTIGYGCYLLWQLWVWWFPFALGADAERKADYAARFGHTLKVIPAFGDHLPPDAQNLTLQLLALATLIVTAMATARMSHL